MPAPGSKQPAIQHATHRCMAAPVAGRSGERAPRAESPPLVRRKHTTKGRRLARAQRPRAWQTHATAISCTKTKSGWSQPRKGSRFC